MGEEEAVTNKAQTQVHSRRGAGHCAAPEEWKRVSTEAFWCCCQAMLLLALVQAEADDAEDRAEEAAVAKLFEVLAKYRPKFEPAGAEVGAQEPGAEAAPAAEEELPSPVSSHQQRLVEHADNMDTPRGCALEPACCGFPQRNPAQVATPRSGS